MSCPPAAVLLPMLWDRTAAGNPRRAIPRCRRIDGPPVVTFHRASLTYFHTLCMVFHMKTTLNIDDSVMRRLKREAARQNRTMSELVETALRLLFRTKARRETMAPLPTFRSGGALVDIADRDALYHAMEGR